MQYTKGAMCKNGYEWDGMLVSLLLVSITYFQRDVFMAVIQLEGRRLCEQIDHGPSAPTVDGVHREE